MRGTGIVFGYPNEKRGDDKADDACCEKRACRIDAVSFHETGRYGIERDSRKDARCDESLVECTHDIAGFPKPNEKCADDRSDDGYGSERERIKEGVLEFRKDDGTEKHRRDSGDRIGLKKIGCHTCTVAHVVAHVVSDDRGVSRVIFGNTCLYFADEVGADVCCLGEDASAKTREDRDKRSAERKADERLHIAGRCEESGNAEERKTDDKKTGDGAALKGEREGLLH